MFNIKRLAMLLIVGLVLSLTLCTIFITVGYFEAYKDKPTELTVEIAGVHIYEIEQVGDHYSGTAINSNMSLIGFIFILSFVIIGEIVAFKKRKKL